MSARALNWLNWLARDVGPVPSLYCRPFRPPRAPPPAPPSPLPGLKWPALPLAITASDALKVDTAPLYSRVNLETSFPDVFAKQC